MNKLILITCVLLQLLNKIHSLGQNGNSFDVTYVDDKKFQNFNKPQPQSAQYNSQENYDAHNQNGRIKILNHYIQSTPGTPTIQTLYQSSSTVSPQIQNNYEEKNLEKLSPGITIHSNQGVNNYPNNQQYSGNTDNSAKYIDAGSSSPGYEVTTTSPGFETNTVQTSSSSQSSKSSSSTSSSSSTAVSTTTSPVSVVHSGSPFSVQIHGNDDQSLINQGHNNYDQVQANYGSSSITPIETHTFETSSIPSAGGLPNFHNLGTSGIISTTAKPQIIVQQPVVSTTSSTTNYNSNDHQSSNSNSFNSAVMSVTPTPYTISVSTPHSFENSHAISSGYLPTASQPPVLIPLHPVGHSISTSNIHNIPVGHSTPPTVFVPSITPQIPIHKPISTSSIHNIPVVTDVPITQFQEHHGVVTETVKVAEPGIKKQTYEIRRPAIQKQFYDIEERVVVRPAGSVVVEIDHPISKTSTGSVTIPTGGAINHSQNDVVSSHNSKDGGGYINLGGHSSHSNGVYSNNNGIYSNNNGFYSSNNGIYSTSSQPLYTSGGVHYPYFTGYFPNICDQFNQHITAANNPAYLNSQAPSGHLISSTTIKPVLEHTTPHYTNSNDDVVVIEPKSTHTKTYNQRYTDIHYNPTTPSPNHQNYKNAVPQSNNIPQSSNNDRPTPFMISVGVPDFNYPPYAQSKPNSIQINELHSQPRSDLHNVGANTLYTMQNVVNNKYLEPENYSIKDKNENYIPSSQLTPENQNNNIQFERYNQVPATNPVHQNQEYNPYYSSNPNQQGYSVNPQGYSVHPNNQQQISQAYSINPNNQHQISQAYSADPNNQNQQFGHYTSSPNNQNQAYTLGPNNENAVSHSPQAYSYAFYNRQTPINSLNQIEFYKQVPENGVIQNPEIQLNRQNQPSQIPFNQNNFNNNNFVRVPVGGIQYYEPPNTNDNINNKYPSNVQTNQNSQPSYEPNQQQNTLTPNIDINFNNSSEYPKINIRMDNFDPRSNNGTNEFDDTKPTDYSNEQNYDREIPTNNDYDQNNEQLPIEDYDSDNKNNSNIRGDVSFNQNNNQPINNDTNNLQISARYQDGPSVNIDYQPKDNNQKKILDYILNNREQYPNANSEYSNGNDNVKSHVISAVPASLHAEPAGERVHTRRIVVNQPIETVQVIEEQFPITNYKHITIQQPTVYKTSSVGLKRVQTSVPVYVQHSTPVIPTYYNYNHNYPH